MIMRRKMIMKKKSSRLFNAMRRFMRLDRKAQKKPVRQQKLIAAKERQQRAGKASSASDGSLASKGAASINKIGTDYTKEQQRIEREKRRKERLKKLEATLNKRYQRLADKYALPLDELIEAARFVEGVSINDATMQIVIDVDNITKEGEKALKEALPSEAAIKKKIYEDFGIRDPKTYGIDQKALRRVIQKRLFFDNEDSVFGRYYDFFEHGGMVKDINLYNEHPEIYSDLAEKMSDLGRIIQKDGYTDEFYNLKDEIYGKLNTLRSYKEDNNRRNRI